MLVEQHVEDTVTYLNCKGSYTSRSPSDQNPGIIR